MEIRAEDVRQVEALAALRLDAAERERMRAHLQRILAYMQQLDDVDVRDVPPTSHVLEAGNVLRPDVVQPSPPAAALLANAPDTRAGFYRVPRFVGE